MVYGFAKQSGGSVKIDSRPAEGTTVRLFFPAAQSGAHVAATGPLAFEEDYGSERILLVEDQDQVAELAHSILADAGYQVVRARSGEEALAVLDGMAEIDLLFSDVVMPGVVSGLSLAQAFIQRIPDSKVLMTTGYTMETIEPVGNMRILPKPYRRSELLSAVRAVLDRG